MKSLLPQSAAGERKEAYRELLKALLERGQGRIRWIGGVQLVVSDDHDPKSPLGAIKFAVATDPESPSLLPEARWQRCSVHFERNILAQVPARESKAVVDPANPYPQGGTPALELKVVFKAKRLSTSRALAKDFVEHYRSRFPEAVKVFESGLDDALSFLAFPSSHQRLIRSTNLLERLFREVKRTRSSNEADLVRS